MVNGLLFLLFLAPRSRTEVPPINEDDPELYVEWTTPKDSLSFWWRYSRGAEFVGNLFAGRAQFPWIVDIRSVDKDMEQWSVGNLLTLSHVLTSNRGILVYTDFEVNQINQASITVEQDAGLDLHLEKTSVHINFCGSYLWEDYKFNIRKNWLLLTNQDIFATDVKNTGTRYARFMFRHPNWSQFSLAWDVGIIKLSYPIRPNLPVVDIMPFWFDFTRGTITDVDLSQMEKQRRICYVGSFGKNWINVWNTIVQDYKVKYRVYYVTNFTKCLNQLPNYKTTIRKVPLVFDKNKKGEDNSSLMCFETRARAGAICDHDRGAPLVCNGLVYGFVVRAANYTHCNNLLPLPFLIQKSTVLNSYFASIISHTYIYDYKKPTPKGSTERIAPARLTYILTFSFLVLLWHNLPNHDSFTSEV